MERWLSLTFPSCLFSSKFQRRFRSPSPGYCPREVARPESNGFSKVPASKVPASKVSVLAPRRSSSSNRSSPWGSGEGLGVLREAGLAPAPTFAMGAAVGVVAFLLLLRRCGARLRRKATVRTAVEMGRLARPHSANASPRGLTFTQ